MEYTKDLFEKLRPDASVATSGRNFMELYYNNPALRTLLIY